MPYIIDPHFNETQRVQLAKAMENYHSQTCVRFEPRNSSDEAYIEILRDDSICAEAEVCRRGRKQFVKFGAACANSAIMVNLHN